MKKVVLTIGLLISVSMSFSAFSSQGVLPGGDQCFEDYDCLPHKKCVSGKCIVRNSNFDQSSDTIYVGQKPN